MPLGVYLTQVGMPYRNLKKIILRTQYRSEIFYEDDIQKAEAKEILEIFNKKLNGKIQTNISRLKNYCKAEEYHQKYLEKNR